MYSNVSSKLIFLWTMDEISTSSSSMSLTSLVYNFCSYKLLVRDFLSIGYFYEVFLMTSSNGNIFRNTGPLCGEFTGPGEFPSQRPVTRSFDVFFDLHNWISVLERLWSGTRGHQSLLNAWVNNREAGDLRRHRAHYNVIVMESWFPMYWT